MEEIFVGSMGVAAIHGTSERSYFLVLSTRYIKNILNKTSEKNEILTFLVLKLK
jgi:hypothetical protein